MTPELRGRRRPRWRGRAAVAVLLCMIPGLPGCSPADGATAGPTEDDALHRRVLGELGGFTSWLEANAVEGHIGEFGVPDDGDPRWLGLADAWLAEADRSGLWADAWATGQWWGTDYDYSLFVSPDEDAALDSARPTGELVARAARATELLRGINLNGAEFGATGSEEDRSAFSNENPGVPGRDYHYDGQATWDYLASQGFDTVRLPFRWERIQPVLGAPLDPAELARLRGAVDRARAAGLRVVLDVHNYGGYLLAEDGQGVRRPIGSPEVGSELFADLWRRLSEEFAGDPAVAAYDLMNEPSRLPGTDGRTPAQAWEAVTQEAVSAVRATGDDTLIMVPGYRYSQVAGWARTHPRAWIDDPAGNVRYTAHHYWRMDYGRSYDEEVGDAAAAGY